MAPPNPLASDHGPTPEAEANLPEDHWPLPEIWDKDRERSHEPAEIDFAAVQQSDEYRRLRGSFLRFAFPMVAVFVGYYFVFVLLATFAPDFMGTRIGGTAVPIGVPLGLLAFACTWFATWAYVRYANRTLDPASTALRERLEQEGR